jgi:hypothetical protein
MYECNKCYIPRSNLVKNENYDVHAVSDSILSIWKSYFCHPLNVNNINNFRQIVLRMKLLNRSKQTRPQTDHTRINYKPQSNLPERTHT